MKEYTQKKRPHNGNKGGNKGGNRGGFHNPGAAYNNNQRNGNFNFDTIHGLKLIEVDYTVPSREDRKAKRAEFNGDRENGVEGVRSKFLKHLAETRAQELVDKLGLTETDIEGMKKGFTPNGFNVHHKLALHGGGKNEFSNFILTPLYPHDQWHHDIMDPQLEGIREGETRRIKIPYTEDMIYDPKKYGYMKDNQIVATPNFTSCVKEDGYAPYWRADQISVEKRQEAMKDIYAQYAAQAAEREQQELAAAQAAAKSPKPNRLARAAAMARVRQRS